MKLRTLPYAADADELDLTAWVNKKNLSNEYRKWVLTAKLHQISSFSCWEAKEHFELGKYFHDPRKCTIQQTPSEQQKSNLAQPTLSKGETARPLFKNI